MQTFDFFNKMPQANRSDKDNKNGLKKPWNFKNTIEITVPFSITVLFATEMLCFMLGERQASTHLQSHTSQPANQALQKSQILHRQIIFRT